MTTTIEKRRSRGWNAALLIAAALFGVLLVTLLIPRVAPWSPPEFSCDTSVITEGADVHFFTLDGNGVDDGVGDDESVPKEVLGAFGVNADMGSVQGSLDELCRRMQLDPSLVAAVSAAFGLIEPTHAATVTAERTMLDNRAYWAQMVDEVHAQIAAMSSIGSEGVPAGSPTMYMVPTADKSFVNLYRGTTSFDGVILKFTREDGSVVKLRLDCGFQPIFETPPDFPDCVDECDNPPCPPGNEIPDCSPKLPELDVVIPWTSIEGLGPQTDGGESERQQASGDTSGNVTDNPVSGSTGAGDTTSDTGDTVIVGGSKDTGEDTSNDVKDTGVIKDDPGGTDGNGEIAVPAD